LRDKRALSILEHPEDEDGGERRKRDEQIERHGMSFPEVAASVAKALAQAVS
jgi:hypothetical protein